MPTLFALLIQVCGLSHREAAAFLDVRLDTVKSWSTGRNPTPARVVEELGNLAFAIEEAADKTLEYISEAPAEIELPMAADDKRARELGWPCLGAHRAMIALAAARAVSEGLTVHIIPSE